jgi:predicted transcriptional regulator
VQKVVEGSFALQPVRSVDLAPANEAIVSALESGSNKPGGLSLVSQNSVTLPYRDISPRLGTFSELKEEIRCPATLKALKSLEDLMELKPIGICTLSDESIFQGRRKLTFEWLERKDRFNPSSDPAETEALEQRGKGGEVEAIEYAKAFINDLNRSEYIVRHLGQDIKLASSESELDKKECEKLEIFSSLIASRELRREVSRRAHQGMLSDPLAEFFLTLKPGILAAVGDRGAKYTISPNETGTHAWIEAEGKFSMSDTSTGGVVPGVLIVKNRIHSINILPSSEAHMDVLRSTLSIEYDAHPHLSVEQGSKPVSSFGKMIDFFRNASSRSS